MIPHQVLWLCHCAGCFETVVFTVLWLFQLLLKLFSLFSAGLNKQMNKLLHTCILRILFVSFIPIICHLLKPDETQFNSFKRESFPIFNSTKKAFQFGEKGVLPIISQGLMPRCSKGGQKRNGWSLPSWVQGIPHPERSAAKNWKSSEEVTSGKYEAWT